MDIREKYTEEELIEMFDDMLDEVYPMFNMGQLLFYPSYILKSCDPIAYDISFDEYLDHLQEQEDDE